MLYILSKTGDIGYFRLMKTMFCADRQNLLRWGEQITDQEYFARKHGPVPASAYDGLVSAHRGAGSVFSDVLTVKGNFMIVHPMRVPDMGYLSETDRESIDKAVDELKGLNRDQIEGYLHEKIYRKVLSTEQKKYSHTDIAMSGGASDKQIDRIKNEERLLGLLT